MSYLFKIEGNKVYPNDETLLIHPFKDIWERDKSPEKEIAIKELTYIEFMTSQLRTNPYKGYRTERRDEILRKDIIRDDKWEPDATVEEAMKKIEEFQREASPNYKLYLASLKAKENLEDFLLNVDLQSEENKTDKGAMVLKPKDITTALLDVDKVTASLTALFQKIEEEIYEEIKVRAGKKISFFATPESFEKK